MKKTKRFILKFIASYIIISLILPNLLLLTKSFWVIAASENENISINQSIIKYIPYFNSNEDNGVIIQEKISIVANNLIDSNKLEIEIENPEYNGIMPVKIEIFTREGKVSQDNKEKEFYINENNKTKIEVKLENETSINKEYYVTYQYDKSAYEKYLETTHVNEYEGGSINRIEKDDITGETWVYIDFSWDQSQGERPDGKVLMDKTPISININARIHAKDDIEQENKLEKELDVRQGSFIDTSTEIDLKQISKGKLYAKKDINYEITHVNNIVRSDILNELQIDDFDRRFYR